MPGIQTVDAAPLLRIGIQHRILGFHEFLVDCFSQQVDTDRRGPTILDGNLHGAGFGTIHNVLQHRSRHHICQIYRMPLAMLITHIT